MRARNSLWLLIVLLLGITQLSPPARPQAGAGLTGAVLIEQLRSAGESLITAPGDYGVRVTPKARRWYTAWLACTSSRPTSYAITILPPAAFTIDWQVRATCQTADRHEVKAGGFGGTNSSCSSRSFPVQWSPPAKEGYRIVGARQVDRVPRDHCNASGPNGRGWDITPDGGAIAGSIVCDGRSGRNPFGCSGGGTGYEFDLFATIERIVPADPVTRTGSLPNLGFGGTAQAPVGTLCPSPTGITLLGTVHYPSGVPDQVFVPASEKIDVPIALSLPDGARLDWEPKSATVTAAAPLNRCKAIY